MLCTVGFANSFGVFEEYYKENQLADQSQSAISWLGAIEVFFIFAGSIVTGPLLDTFGPEVSHPGFLSLSIIYVSIWILTIMVFLRRSCFGLAPLGPSSQL